MLRTQHVFGKEYKYVCQYLYVILFLVWSLAELRYLTKLGLIYEMVKRNNVRNVKLCIFITYLILTVIYTSLIKQWLLARHFDGRRYM